MSDKPYFLELENFHMGTEKATAVTVKGLLDFGVSSPKGGWHKLILNLGDGDIKFTQLVSIVKKTGVIPYVQGRLDNNDDIFGGNSFGISTPTQFGPVTSTYAGFSKTLISPMSNQPMETELSNDIMYYREQVCLWSDEYDFKECTRYYRAYLSACISLVDAFINRHILIYKHTGQFKNQLEELERTGRLVDRISLFLSMTTGKDVSELNSGLEWIHFKKLRELRNEMTHISTPSLGYSIPEFSEHLNYVRQGVGGLLWKIRNLQGKSSLGFIEHIRSAPIVFYNDITEKGGKIQVKRRKK